MGTAEAGEEALAGIRLLRPEIGEEEADRIAVKSAMNEILLEHGMGMIHAAAVAAEGEAYLFAAHGGGGKTTHALQWKKAFGSSAEILCGDYPTLSFDENRAFVSGSPWRGKEELGGVGTLPVAGIAFLVQGRENRIRALGSGEIIRRLFDQLVIPETEERMQDYLRLADRLMRTVPFYELTCDISEDAARTSYTFMKENRYENG